MATVSFSYLYFFILLMPYFNSYETQALSQTRDHMHMWTRTQDRALLLHEGVDGAFLPCLCIPASISLPLSWHPLPSVDACLISSLFYFIYFSLLTISSEKTYIVKRS
jgi:hypothetical protein